MVRNSTGGLRKGVHHRSQRGQPTPAKPVGQRMPQEISSTSSHSPAIARIKSITPWRPTNSNSENNHTAVAGSGRPNPWKTPFSRGSTLIKMNRPTTSMGTHVSNCSSTPPGRASRLLDCTLSPSSARRSPAPTFPRWSPTRIRQRASGGSARGTACTAWATGTPDRSDSASSFQRRRQAAGAPSLSDSTSGAAGSPRSTADRSTCTSTSPNSPRSHPHSSSCTREIRREKK